VKGLILCAGKGTRLRPFSHSLSKPLLPLANRPVVVYLIDKLAAAGVTDVGLVVRPDHDDFRETLGTAVGGVRLTYIVQSVPLGLAHALLVARPFLGEEPFVLLLGDNIFSASLSPLLEEFRARGAAGLLSVCRVPDPERFGVVELHGSRVRRLWEKPADPPTELAVAGIYAFTPDILARLDDLAPSARGELEISDAIQSVIDAGLEVHARRLPGWWNDIGTMEGLLLANQRLLEAQAHAVEAPLQDSTAGSPVRVEWGARVTDSRIHGPAAIGAGTAVSRARIGPHASVGRDVTIVNARLRNCIVMDGAVIRDIPGVLTDSLIGRNARLLALEAATDEKRVVVGDDSRIWI